MLSSSCSTFKGSSSLLGLALFRATGCIAGLLSGAALVRAASGNADVDAYPFFFIFCLHGCPTTICWFLRAHERIDASTEARVLTVAFFGILCANATKDKAAIEVQEKGVAFLSSNPVLWPVVSSSCSVLGRVCWDPQMSAGLLLQWVASLVSLLILHLMTDVHHHMLREAQRLASQREFQESLLVQAFDATMDLSFTSSSMEDVAAAGCGDAAAAKLLSVSRSSDSLDRLMGRRMESKPLRGNMSEDSVKQLEELMRIAEESAWDSQSSGPLRPAIITCYDSEGMEFDCELRAVIQPPTAHEEGGLLCGLRRAGESRPRDDGEGAALQHKLKLPQGRRADLEEPSNAQEDPRPTSSLGPMHVLTRAVRNMLVSEGAEEEHRRSSGGKETESKLQMHSLQCIVWETVRLFPDAVALWCTRGDFKILQMSPCAARTLQCQVGHHVSTCLAFARHALLLRQVVKVAESRVEADPTRLGHFYAHPSVKLSFRVASSVVDMPMKTLLLASTEQQPCVFFLIGAPKMYYATTSMDLPFCTPLEPVTEPSDDRDDSDLRSESVPLSTLLPDDSVSQIDFQEGSLANMRQRGSAAMRAQL